MMLGDTILMYSILLALRQFQNFELIGAASNLDAEKSTPINAIYLI